MADTSPLHHDVGNRHTPDQFQRKPFAERLAQTIAKRTSRESFVIGLYGAWGEGKTTVLDYMDEALTAEAGVVLIRFNPWLFSSDEAMTAGLITTIADEVDIQLEAKVEGVKNVARLMATYGGKLAKTIGAVIGNSLMEKAGEQTEGLGDMLGPKAPTLEQLKDTISAQLLQLDTRVVILMDDIDRLTRAEIQRVFRLIKVGADFPTLTYVLAFDPDMVASAIGEQYGSGDAAEGQRFLEKIVQLPLHLPYLDRPSLTDYTYDLLTQTLDDIEVGLNNRQLERFRDALQEDIMPVIRTPRQAKRYANAAGFAIPILRDDTDPVDVLLVEALRVMFPAMFRLIREQSEAFLSPQSAWGFIRDDPEGVKDRLDKVLEGQDPHAVHIVRDLFPEVGQVLGGFGFHMARGDEDLRSKGVFRSRYFLRYFQYAIPGDDISDTMIDLFFQQAVRVPDQADVFLSSLASGKSAFKFLTAVREVFRDLNPGTRRGVALAVARSWRAFDQNRYTTAIKNPHDRIMSLMAIATLESPEVERPELATDLMNLLPEEVALQFVEGLERAPQDQVTSFLPQLQGDLSARLERHGAELKTVLGMDYTRGLRLIARARGRGISETNLRLLLETGEPAVVDFLVGLSATTGKFYLPNTYDQQNYVMLKVVADPDALIQLFEPFFPVVTEAQSPSPDVMSRMFSDDDGQVSDRRDAAAEVAARIRTLRAVEVEHQKTAAHLNGPSDGPLAPPDES